MEKYDSLALSGLPGSGKSHLLKLLMKETGWPSSSIGDLHRARLKYLQATGQIDQKWTIKEYWTTVSDGENIRVNEELLKLVNNGRMIADLRFAFHLEAANKKPLLVFLTADLGIRAERGMKTNPDYKGRSIEEVKSILMQREKDEVETGLKLFKKDYRILSNYDIVLDSGKMSIEDEAREIIRHLKTG